MIGLGRMPEVSNALSGIFRVFQGFGEGGHDFEDVANHAVVGDFKNRGVRILVDGDDSARAFHAYHVLNRAADAQREIKFWRDGLAGAAYLAFHGEPAFITTRAGRGDLAAEGFGESFS